MNKSVFPVIAIMAMVASCATINEPESQNPVSENETILQIRGNVNDVDTKTAITEDASVFHSAWVNGNVIRVDVDDLSHKKTATYNSGTGLFTCSITGLSEGDHTVNAAYPSSTGIANSTKYSFTVPPSQTMPSVNAFDESADFLVAQTKVLSVDGSGTVSTVDMDFRRAVGIVKIIPVDGTTDPAKSLDGLKIKSITITSEVSLKTKIKITPGLEDDTTETNAYTFSVSYAGNDFEFNANKSGTNGAYIVFAPGKFTASKSLRFDIVTDNASYTISKTIASLPSDITFGANELRPITVTFNDSCVEVATPAPTLSASDLTIESDDTGGTIDFTVSNLVDGGYVVKDITSDGLDNSSWGAVSFNSSTGAGSLSFTCDENTDPDYPKTATVHLFYTTDGSTELDAIDVTVTQKKTGYVAEVHTWDFSTWTMSDVTGVASNTAIPSTFTENGLTFIPKGSDSKWNSMNVSSVDYNYIVTGGNNNESTVEKMDARGALFKFTTSTAGTVTVVFAANGNSSRKVCLRANTDAQDTTTSPASTSTSDIKTATFTSVPAGTIRISGDSSIRICSISFVED